MSFAGIDHNMAIMIAASLSVFASVVGLSLPFLRRDRLAARMKMIARRREELTSAQRARLQPARRRRAPTKIGLMKAVIDRLKLQGQTASRGLRSKLARAGWRGQTPMITYVFMQVVSPVSAGLLVGLFVFGAGRPDIAISVKLLATFVGALIGFFLPRIIVANMIQRRQTELTRGFPDALDLLVLCVEAGLSLDAAFSRVAVDLQDSAPVVAEEFGLTNAELALLGDRRAAFANLADRTGLEDFRSLTTALIQAEKYGTSLGVILRVLARENRDHRMLRAENKAGRLPATLTVPMMTFFMPVLFIVILGPAVIQTIRTFQ
jgi:tight adherence protein C